MQKNMTKIDCIVNGKEVNLTCDMTCTTIEIKEALFQFIKHVGQVEDAHAAKLRQEQESPVEVIEDSKAEINEA